MRYKINHSFAQKTSLFSLVVENHNFNSLKLVEKSDFPQIVKLIMSSKQRNDRFSISINLLSTDAIVIEFPE